MFVSTFVLAVGISVDVSYLLLGSCMAALGLGLGLSFGPASTAAIESAPKSLAGAASGTNSMMRYLGSIIGAGILGSVLSQTSGTPDIWLFRLILLVVMAVAGLACASTFFIHRFPQRESPDEWKAAAAGEARAGAAPDLITRRL
jgi:MFS family permease